MFGRPHILCDHPRAVERIDPERPEVQIMHVHGTYWYYDCCQLRPEIEERARADPSILTVGSQLDRILAHRSPIVIGYAGWEGDVIMTALQRRLTTATMDCNIYWFCYREDDINALPEWLKSHDCVCFVTASPRTAAQPKASRIERDSGELADELERKGQAQLASAAAVGGPTVDDTLTAQAVLDELVRSFALEAPDLTKDPLAFFAQQVEANLAMDDAGQPGEDIYSIASVVQRLRHAKEADAQYLEVGAQIEAVRDAMRRSQYREAIEQAHGLEPTHLDTTQLEEIAEAAWTAAIWLTDNSTEEILGYDLAARFAESALNEGNVGKEPMRFIKAYALTNKAITLSQIDQPELALSTYQEVVTAFGEAPEAEIRERVAWALAGSSIVLRALDRAPEAIAMCNEVVQRFGDAVEPELRTHVAQALVFRGFSLGDLRRHREEIASYSEVVRRFGDATELELRERVAWALDYQGRSEGLRGHHKKAIASYNELVRRYGDATELELRQDVASALVSKASSLGSLGYHLKAAATYREVLRRFADATEPELQKWVKMAEEGLSVPKLSLVPGTPAASE